MVVGQHHRGGVDAQCHLHNPADGYPGGIDAALPHLFAAEDLALGVQAQQEHRLIAPAVKEGQQVIAALFHAGQNLGAHGPGDHGIARSGRDQRQKGGNVFPHALDLLQLLRRRLQHLIQGAKMLQQRVGQWVGILLGNAVEQQQLQNLMLVEIIQALLPETVFQPLPVAVMNGHWDHLRVDFPCYFFGFRLE